MNEETLMKSRCFSVDHLHFSYCPLSLHIDQPMLQMADNFVIWPARARNYGQKMVMCRIFKYRNDNYVMSNLFNYYFFLENDQMLELLITTRLWLLTLKIANIFFFLLCLLIN